MPKGVYVHYKIRKTLEQRIIRAVRAALSTPRCGAPGCLEFSQDCTCGYCPAHYVKMRRGASLFSSSFGRTYVHDQDYIIENNPDHPLAVGGMVYQHRRVYYDEHGPGPFTCHWCGDDITWEMLHIDHVDGCRQNNANENLVAACPPCNHGRGTMLKFLARVILYRLKMEK